MKRGNITPFDIIHGGFYQYIKDDKDRYLVMASLEDCKFHIKASIKVSERNVSVIEKMYINGYDTIPFNDLQNIYGIPITPGILTLNGFRSSNNMDFIYLDRFHLHRFSSHLYFASYSNQPTSEAFFYIHELQRALISRRMIEQANITFQ